VVVMVVNAVVVSAGPLRAHQRTTAA
jgi:hypothetical protein